MQPSAMSTKPNPKYKPVIEQENIPRGKSRRNYKFSDLKLADTESYLTKSVKSVNNNTRKNAARMDKALNSNQFFKRKDLKLRTPYGSGSNFSAIKESQVRRSVDNYSAKNIAKRNRYNVTGDSMRETRAVSDMKSSYNVANANSEYSFNDRGFKEYTYHPLKKTRIRPMTAGVQRKQGGKIIVSNTL